MTTKQKKYISWLKKNLKVTSLKSFNNLKDFISDSNKEICDFYIFRDWIKVVRLDKTAKWYMVRPSK